jgi:hypothetical protein
MTQPTDPDAAAIVPAALTPMAMLQIAVSQNADLEKIAKLMELQERWEANEARKAFNVAFSAFKAEAIRILKNTLVSDGPLKGKQYADLFAVVDTITPFLSKHGLSHSWKLTKDDPTWMEVTCTLRHAQGHAESVSMGAAPDTGPGRNAIQARMSANTYLERYTLLAITGMAAAGTDTDGRVPDGIDMETVDKYVTVISESQDFDALRKNFAAAYKGAQAKNDRNAMQRYMDAKDARKTELEAIQ